jgi:hypothetical protein
MRVGLFSPSTRVASATNAAEPTATSAFVRNPAAR